MLRGAALTGRSWRELRGFRTHIGMVFQHFNLFEPQNERTQAFLSAIVS